MRGIPPFVKKRQRRGPVPARGFDTPCHACHIFGMITIEIPARELHAVAKHFGLKGLDVIK